MTTVSSGQSESGLIVPAGSTLTVLSGGSVTHATVAGEENISGGIDTFGTITNVETVFAGGLAVSTLISGFEAIQTLSGGTATDNILAGGAIQIVSAGGISDGTQVAGGAFYEDIRGPAFEQNIEDVFLSGRADDTLVTGGGYLAVRGGESSGTVLSGSISFQRITFLGPVSVTLLSEEEIDSGSSYGTLVGSGGDQLVAGGVAYDAIVETGGEQVVTSAIGASTYTFGVASHTTIAGGELDIRAGGTVSGDIIFTGSGGVLRLENSGSSIPTGTISGFAPTDAIVLAATPYQAGDEVALLGGNVLVVTQTDGQQDQFQLDPNQSFAGHHFDVAQFGSGTVITEDNALCFCPGTLIRTEDGERPVETLQIGDRVSTVHGDCQAVKWIGRRSYDGRFIRDQPLMLPVCVKAGAIGDGVPARDLYLSPRHALYIDGVLVPAGLLVNGVTITQAEAVTQVSYIHVELADHDVIFAEGCPAETFADIGQRAQFANVGEFALLYPAEVDDGPMRLCAPRIEDGFHLEAIQQRLAARANVPPVSDHLDMLSGFIDIAGPQMVAGWAQDEANPERPVCLDILVDGRRVQRVLANRYRADLRRAGKGSGRHAFEVQIESVGGVVEVRRSADQALLMPTDAAYLKVA